MGDSKPLKCLHKLRRVTLLVLSALLLAACGVQVPQLERGVDPRQAASSPAPLTPGPVATATAGAPGTTPTHTAEPVGTSTPTPFLPATSTPTVTPPPTLLPSAVDAFNQGAVIQTAEARVSRKMLLPDLQTLPPHDVRLVYDRSSGRKYVRFGNSILNGGSGRLELVGRPDPAAGQIQVLQRIYTPGGATYGEQNVGQFIFHPNHNHWHLEGFAIYEIWSLDETGELDKVVASGGKISYCVTDVRRGPSESKGPRWAAYTNCWGELQGLSPNWIDTYDWHLYGQWVEITDLPNGVYALVSTADPDDFILEKDEKNNTGLIYFELEDARLDLVGG